MQNKQISTEFVAIPTKQETEQAPKITFYQMIKLEKLWRTNPKATLEDIIEHKEVVKVKAPPKIEHDDAYKFYKRRFIGLINLEADEQRNYLTSWKSTARFDFSDDIKPMAIFDTPNEAFINLEVGLQLRIFYEHENRTGFW